MSTQSDVLPPAEELHSLHPLTLVFDALGAVRSLLVPTLLLLIFSSGSLASFLPLVLIAGLQVFVGSMRFVSMRYAIHGEHLVIQEGVLSRRVRTIPIATIQNIYLRRNLLHRYLRVCELRVETAGGGQAEARLSVVAEAQAQRVRRSLLARAPDETAAAVQADVAEEQPDDEHLGPLIRRSSLGELLLAGATANRAGAIFLVLLGLLEFVDQFEQTMRSALETTAEFVLGQLGDDPVVLAAFGILLLVLVGWVVSIFLTLMRYYGFVLHRTPDGEGLHRRQGLLTQFEGVLPLQRVQVLRLEANPPRRLFGRVNVRAETAGSVQEKESAGSTTLCPLLRIREVPQFCRTIFAPLRFDTSRLRPVHPAALRRGYVRFLLLLGLAALFVAFLAGWSVYVPLLVAAFVAWPLAVVRYRAMGWMVEDGYFISRAGIWNLRTWIVPISRIQTLRVVQSPAQRWLHLATLQVDTAGALRFQSARILDLPARTAQRLYEELALQAAFGATHDGI